KAAYEIEACLEFRRVLFRSPTGRHAHRRRRVVDVASTQREVHHPSTSERVTAGGVLRAGRPAGGQGSGVGLVHIARLRPFRGPGAGAAALVRPAASPTRRDDVACRYIGPIPQRVYHQLSSRSARGTTPRRHREKGGVVLDLAILGLLDERPMHGYELRKRLSEMFGTVRTVSFGSLYPTLRRLKQQGHIVEDASAETATRPPATARRGRKTYRITSRGKDSLATMLAEPGTASFGDDGFGVHLAFFDRTPGPARVRLLEGRRRVLEERREGQRDAAGRTGPTELRYARQLTRLGLETSERELQWINELIHTENPPQGEPHHD